jgi:hypothetical protein
VTASSKRQSYTSGILSVMFRPTLESISCLKRSPIYSVVIRPLGTFMKYTDLNTKDDFLRYPTNKLLGVVNTTEELQTTIAELNAAGFCEKEIDVLCGKEGAERLDVSGRHHGLLARLYRFIGTLGDESKNLEEYEQELASGHFLLALHAADEDKRTRALEIIKSHGGHAVTFFGRWTAERLVS